MVSKLGEKMAKRRVTKKKVGKTWFKIVAPKVLNENEIGETLAADGKSLIGKVINMYLSDITGDVTKHYIKVKLKIKEVDGDKALTEIYGYEIAKPYLQRMIRRRMSKVDAVVDMFLKDGKGVRIKGVLTTAHRTNVSKKTALLHAFEDEIKKRFGEFDLGGLVVALSTSKPQKEMAKKLSKIYPIRYLEIRKIEMLNKKQILALEKAMKEKEKIVKEVDKELIKEGPALEEELEPPKETKEST